MMAYQRWHKWVLIPSWIIHVAVLIPPATVALFSLVINIVSCSGSSLWHSNTCSVLHQVLFLSDLVCIAFEVREIQLFRQRRLQPTWFLASQLFKSAVFSYWLYRWHFLLASHIWEPVRFAIEASKTASFYATLLYSCYIVHRERKLRLMRVAVNKDVGHTCHDDDDDGVCAAFELPSRLNSSDQIQSKRPIVVGLIQWINSRPAWLDKAPSSCRGLLENGYYFFKCITCYIPVYLMLPWSSRLPGEPNIAGLSYGFGIRTQKTDPAKDWDYPKPDLLQHASYDLVDDRANAASAADEESALGLVNLGRVHEHTRSSEIQRVQEPTQLNRLLGPRYLCILTDGPNEATGSMYCVRRVDDWLAENNTKAVPDYVFISYTRRQFYTQTQFNPTTSPEALSSLQAAAIKDKQTLADFAILAAKSAHVPAFWIDFECVRYEEGETEKSVMEDVYRICDVVRVAHSLAIVLGPSLNSAFEHVLEEESHPAEWLLEWGKRMWTVPEALLCPAEHRIAVYSVGSDKPDLVAKRNLAGRTWEDASAIRQLIDHYEGSLHLTQVELISIAMECLQRRQTERRNAGDVAYVLMGLLRLRPKVTKTDSDFQAFARLSLANDSGRILERILCLRGNEPHSSWSDLQDVWNAKPWQIHPFFQITSVGNDHDDTVNIVNGQGTIIDWRSLKTVDFRCDYPSYKQHWYINRGMTTIGLLWFVVWIYFTFVVFPAYEELLDGFSFSSGQAVFNRFMTPAMVIYSVVNLQTPFALAKHFRAIPSAMQARMFGIRGKPDLDEVEKSMFGASCGRLKWNTDRAGHRSDPDDDRQEYTLIDTLLGTATLIRTSRPPTMAFVGGQEAGFSRLLLCSYDHVARAFVRETVLRTKLVVAEHVQRLDPFYLAAARTVYRDDDDDEATPSRPSFDSDAIEIPDIPEFRSLDD